MSAERASLFSTLRKRLFDRDYSPAYQDEYQRLWQEAAAERDRLREQLRPREAPREPVKTGWEALSDADKAEWTAMAVEMHDPETKACGCGYPKVECLRVVLRNGPPYPPRPCEPLS